MNAKWMLGYVFKLFWMDQSIDAETAELILNATDPDVNRN